MSEDRGVYAVTILYQSGNLTLYTTKDCSLLFLNAYSMNESAIGTAGTGQNTGTSGKAAPVKTALPVVELYVMAFCPYGTQAEGVMKPVVDLLGSKADIRVRYITSVTGTTRIPSSLSTVPRKHRKISARPASGTITRKSSGTTCHCSIRTATRSRAMLRSGTPASAT